MNASKWVIVNLSLGLIALLLILNLSGLQLPAFGQAEYLLDASSPFCAVEWNNKVNSWYDLDSCCSEARKQLHCVSSTLTVNKVDYTWKCFTGSGSIGYYLNDKAYNYCRQQDFWQGP